LSVVPYRNLRRRLRPVIIRATEKIYIHRLLSGLHRIQVEPLECLREVDRVEEIIAGIGLAYDGRYLYGRNNRDMNLFGPGLWQIPRQIAEALCFLSTLNLRSALEIGTYQGWTACVLAAYLQRFEENFQLTTIDPVEHFTAYPLLSGRLPIVYRAARTAEDLAGQSFDLCLIDGDHSYSGCAKDYELCGRFARACMFHDINDKFVGEQNVPRFWRELKKSEQRVASFHEFLYHSENAPVMGIGLRVRSVPQSEIRCPVDLRR
jgi:hypothetical protein